MKIPEDVVRAVGPDALWSDEHEGLSGDVWRVGASYVKRACVDERDRLLWLGERFEVPRIGIDIPGSDGDKGLADRFRCLISIFATHGSSRPVRRTS